MMEFQKLLNKIKEFKDDGTDYILNNVESGNSLSGEIYKEESVYQIFSPQLKKECRRIILCGYVEDGGFSRFGMNIGSK